MAIDNRNIYGFVHVATLGDWRHILQSQIRSIRHSGLYDRCERIDLCKIGEETSCEYQWAVEDYDVHKYELITLSRLYDNAVKVDGISFYIHLKGVSKTQEHWHKHRNFYQSFAGLSSLDELQYNERLWRKYMEYFVIEQHELCIQSLLDHDLCGVEWREKPFPHYSGNFWWATHRYIRTLPSPMEYQKQNSLYQDDMGSNRAVAEFWIGTGRPQAAVLFNSGLNLYHKGLQPHEYGKYKLF